MLLLCFWEMGGVLGVSVLQGAFEKCTVEPPSKGHVGASLVGRLSYFWKLTIY